ncbi:hypothetical protein F4861DRAFT_237931 [Xylaria intraflava]|nr:hypothetical protein F4861DRAFT_237931 [Xylaria intraflava]
MTPHSRPRSNTGGRLDPAKAALAIRDTMPIAAPPSHPPPGWTPMANTQWALLPTASYLRLPIVYLRRFLLLRPFPAFFPFFSFVTSIANIGPVSSYKLVPKAVSLPSPATPLSLPYTSPHSYPFFKQIVVVVWLPRCTFRSRCHSYLHDWHCGIFCSFVWELACPDWANLFTILSAPPLPHPPLHCSSNLCLVELHRLIFTYLEANKV